MRTRHIKPSSDLVPSVERVSAIAEPVKHQSVLLHEAIEALSISERDTVVDATLGGAGHSRLITSSLSAEGMFIGFDLDADAIDRASQALVDARPQTLLIQENFRNMEQALTSRGITHIDKALFDLGWSAYQLTVGRGFSFLRDEPLLMTYAKADDGTMLTAATIINTWAETSIADIIFGWGEERYSRRIARAIIERRRSKPFELATDLAETIRSAVPAAYRNGRLHPATRTFQALRIATNDELGAVRDGVLGAWKLLRLGGRIAVITFHSIEDRVVKELFLELERGGDATRITRSPTKPTREELLHNPRARSAKLRVIEKN
jgi:16S rRNA (cytosine1402-N4)-methyltransferase